jgi:hypothetical protein
VHEIGFYIDRPGMVIAIKTVVYDVRGEAGAFSARTLARLAYNRRNAPRLCNPSLGVVPCLVTVAQEEQGISTAMRPSIIIIQFT